MKIKSNCRNHWQKRSTIHTNSIKQASTISCIIYNSIKIGTQSSLINLTFFIHINAFLRKTINKAITWPSHAHMYSDHGYSSVFVDWTIQVCLQTRLKWWQWWGTPDIIWNRVPDRRRSRRKWSITKCCLTVGRSIEKRHGVWAGASVAGVQLFFYAAWQWHLMVQYCCGSGSTNKLIWKCFLLWQEANEVILSVWLY